MFVPRGSLRRLLSIVAISNDEGRERRVQHLDSSSRSAADRGCGTLTVTMPVKVILISGSMGAGKTTVLGEASDILAEHGTPHAAIDLDAIGAVLLIEDATKELSLRNLAALYSNFVAAGVTRMLLAEPIETRDQLQQLQQVMVGAELVLCRLTADIETMQRRLRIREPGIYQDRFVARCQTLQDVLEAGRLEDFTVSNDGRSITDVAREVLVRAAWIT